jgi:hypothetical protein
VYLITGNIQSALQVYDEALRLRRMMLRDDHLNDAATVFYLGQTYHHIRDMPMAGSDSAPAWNRSKQAFNRVYHHFAAGLTMDTTRSMASLEKSTRSDSARNSSSAVKMDVEW